MAKNKIVDLRDHLFETIEKLKNPDDNETMTVEKAKVIADLAQVIVNSAKVEVDMVRLVDKQNGIYQSTGFIPLEDATKKLTP